MSGLGQNLVDASLVHERDEPEAPGSLCQRVPHHQALFHLAELAEVLPQALLRGLPAQSPDEHFAGVVRGVRGGEAGLAAVCLHSDLFSLRGAAPHSRGR